ncbi:MAG TPA: DUF58 domain-containing protein [Gemmatimonadaceae bacterium]|nr:DUF58 domain-containing protein [Gemmatimonadaceae bacterium]
MTAAAPPTTSFLDPSVLGRIGNLELLARTVVEGFINGLHRSPHLGASTDFAEHRAYMPGDDIRRIDWRLYARSDRYYIKEYEAETNTNFQIILDVSPSMHYGATSAEEGGRPSKLTYACYLAACLAYFSSLQRDRIGLATIDTDIVDYVPPSAKHLQQILHTLDRIERGRRDAKVSPGKSTLDPPLKKLSDTLKRRSLVLLISDFYEDADVVLRALTHARGRGNDLIVFHLLDPREIDFTFSDSSNFIDMETGEKMPVIPDYLRQQYREIVREHTDALSKRIGETRADYALFDTSKPLDRALYAFLGARQRFTRVR